MVPGPLGLRWKGRVLPRLETGELAAYDPPTAYRARRWFDLAPRIGEHAFLKLYTHGAQEANLQALLSTGLRNLFKFVREEAERRGAQLHFVSAWQMYLAIEGIGEGKDAQHAVLGCGISNRGSSALNTGLRTSEDGEPIAHKAC
jgi:hypothetical protein